MNKIKSFFSDLTENIRKKIFSIDTIIYTVIFIVILIKSIKSDDYLLINIIIGIFGSLWAITFIWRLITLIFEKIMYYRKNTLFKNYISKREFENKINEYEQRINEYKDQINEYEEYINIDDQLLNEAKQIVTEYDQQINDLQSLLEDVRESKISYDSKIVIYDVKIKDEGKEKGFFRPAEVLVSTYRIVTKDESGNTKAVKQEIVAYYLLKAYWKKGGWLSFYSEDKEKLLYKLKLNEYTPCVDSHGDKHEAMLTLKKEMWKKWGLDKKQKPKLV